MERIALLTCNIDEFDDVREIPKQTIPFDFYNYNESNLNVSGHNYWYTDKNGESQKYQLSKRLLSKYPKLMTSYILPNYDIYIWIDGRVEIKSEKFVETMIDNLQEVRIATHPDRQNCQQEFDFIESELKMNNPYLNVRYTFEGMEAEKRYFIDNLASYPLYASGIFARRNKPLINIAFREIWEMCIQCGNLDQVLFSLIERSYKLNYVTVPFYNDLFHVGVHLKEYRK